MENVLSYLQFGSHERRVKKYLEEATRESVLDDLNKALAPWWAGTKDVWAIFWLHRFKDGYGHYWDVESFRWFLTSRHPGIASYETTYLLWRCLHFYAHYPFARSSRGSRIDEKGFQRVIALLVFRGTALLGTKERGEYWRDDESAFRQADFRRILASLSEPSLYYSAGKEWTVTETDVMDVLATTQPHSTNLAPSAEQLRDAAERVMPKPSISYHLLPDEFTLFVRLLLQMRVWDMQGSCLPSGMFNDDSSSACQELADSIAAAICNEDQTIDPGIVADVLPGLRERFYRLWGVLFQPSSLRERIVPPEEHLPNRILAAVSLLLPLATRVSPGQWTSDSTLQFLPGSKDIGIDHLLEQLRGNRYPCILLFTDENCTAVVGAYIPNLSSHGAESHCSGDSRLDDSGHFLFQLSPRFCLLRSTGLRLSLGELFCAERKGSPVEGTATMDQKKSLSYTIGHEQGARLDVDPQSLTVTMAVNLDELSEEKATYTNIRAGQNRKWELTVHPAKLHILRVDPSASTPTLSRNTSKERVSGEELRNRIHGFGSSNSETPSPNVLEWLERWNIRRQFYSGTCP
ncbi:hypothetical protein CFD26_100980 [Aspergillus turcosus]|uniref:TLDc domain-containing protein n=1 Tax=Aspergillus turcosus TaxID=1245748 RepID=A0A421D487_9EURO|nr:hypothetical protein CFD26_100980 [Aspergillus turcosus]